ncbi:unnamed protein product, partial [Adineta steineri]
RKPVTLLNTSLSLDVLDIILRDKQQLNDDDDCEITNVFINKSKTDEKNDFVQLSSLDDEILPLPLWDRIRQRTAV